MAFFRYGRREIQYLTEKDKVLGEAVEKIGHVERKVNPGLFGALVSSIVNQQISTRTGRTIRERMYDGLSEVTPEMIGKCPVGELQAFGISFRKMGYIKNTARKMLDGELDPEALHTMSDEEVYRELSSLRSIGVWTIEMLATPSTQRPDVFSSGDLVIRRGLRILYHHRKIDEKLFEKYRRHYPPCGTVTSLCLWVIASGAIKGMRDCALKKKQENRHMKIIAPPAKKMWVDTDNMEMVGIPVYVEEMRRSLEVLRGYLLRKLQKLFAVNEDIIRLSYEHYQDMSLEERLTPAVFSHVGIQCQSMTPGVFISEQWGYMNHHLRILSGFYGILNACDGVVPYHLEIQAKLPVDGCQDLYKFWGDRLYRGLVKEDQVIINLASEEYSEVAEPYIGKDVTFLTYVFTEEQAGEPKAKTTAVKIARGTMVRRLVEYQVQSVEKVKEFDEGGYWYCGEASGEGG